MIVVLHLITAVEWESFRKYHIKQCVFRDDISKKSINCIFHLGVSALLIVSTPSYFLS